MKKYKVSIQGQEASFSHIAARNLFDVEPSLIYRDFFPEVFEDLASSRADLILIPIENSTYGSIFQNYDLMTKYNVLIIAEIYLKINFHLISFEGNTLENIKQVYSHPVALGQIRQFLHEHKHIQALEFSDTAGAVNMIKQKYKDSNNKYNYGAVASAFAAHTYGMTIIKEDILENQNNYTRFFLLKKVDDPKTYEIKNNIKNSAKVSLEFQLGEEAGTLYKCLEPFAKRDIAIVKIESRPIINTHWQFTFYMDIKADYSDNNFKAALSELINNTAKLRVIGYYHKGDYIPT